MEKIKSQLESVFQQFPDLSPLGFCSEYAFYPWCWSKADIDKEIKRGQTWLLSSNGLIQILIIIYKLKAIQKTKNISNDRRVNSKIFQEELKKVLNLAPGNLSHGPVIAGAILSGFKLQRSGLYAQFNMNIKSLKKSGFYNE